MKIKFMKCENEFMNVGLNRSIKNFLRSPSMVLVFTTYTKFSSQFFDLDIENPVGRGPLAEFETLSVIQAGSLL